jgi:hypothetical protein
MSHIKKFQKQLNYQLLINVKDKPKYLQPSQQYSNNHCQKVIVAAVVITTA